jgi:hypothetical protein
MVHALDQDRPPAVVDHGENSGQMIARCLRLGGRDGLSRSLRGQHLLFRRSTFSACRTIKLTGRRASFRGEASASGKLLGALQMVHDLRQGLACELLEIRSSIYSWSVSAARPAVTTIKPMIPGRRESRKIGHTLARLTDPVSLD